MVFSSKILRNRIVGLLVILSVIMILVPAIMQKPEPQQDRKDESIAIDRNGAVTDKNGQMVSGTQRDLSELLDPVNDSINREDPLAIARQNAAKDAQKDSNAPVNANQGNIPFDDGFASGEALETVQPKNLASRDAAPVSTAQNIPYGGEVLTGNTPRNVPESKPSSAQTKPEQKPQSKTEQKQQPKPEQKPQSKDNKTADSKSQTVYVVQVGVFSQQTNAQSIMNKLRSQGVSCQSEKFVNNQGKTMYRVYAGSAPTRKGAEAIADKVAKITGDKGTIKTLNR